MTLTHRGRVVVATLFVTVFVLLMLAAGRLEAMDQCATFQANNDYQSALDAGCSFDMMPNGEYPYQWEVQ